MAATTLPYNPRYCFAPVEDTEVGVQQTRIFVEGTIARDRAITHKQAVDLETAGEIYISALRLSIEAVGGTLTVTASFPGLPPTGIPGLDSAFPRD